MTKDDEREVQRKLRILQHAEKTGHVDRTCRYFGIGRASFYRWKSAYERDGEGGLVNAKTIPKNPPTQTPPEVAEKVLHCGRYAPLPSSRQCGLYKSCFPMCYGHEFQAKFHWHVEDLGI